MKSIYKNAAYYKDLKERVWTHQKTHEEGSSVKQWQKVPASCFDILFHLSGKPEGLKSSLRGERVIDSMTRRSAVQLGSNAKLGAALQGSSGPQRPRKEIMTPKVWKMRPDHRVERLAKLTSDRSQPCTQ